MQPKTGKYLLPALFLGLWAFSVTNVAGQEEHPNIHVQVNMVQLNVAVTDSKGNYITGLRPEDFEVTEDGIPEKLAIFSEGHESIPLTTDQPRPEVKVAEQTTPSTAAETVTPASSTESLGSLVSGANVFILFDTSNYM